MSALEQQLAELAGQVLLMGLAAALAWILGGD